MNLTMDPGEIIREYNTAAKKSAQVKILADQNCVKPKEMAEWLRDQGCEVDGRFFASGRTPKERREPIDNIIHPEPVEKDQKAKADAGKPRLSLVPPQIIFDVAAVREYGNRKYPEGGPDSWKQVAPERYRDAAFRHFLEYIRDPKGVDPESGLPHRWHLECNLAFLAELEGEK